MIGIYKYQNKINGKCYIGQSINLEQRKYAHKSSAFNENAKDYNSQFHQAVRKYGLDNFTYEVIHILQPEQYTKKELDKLEIYYIKLYNSYKNGYNATEGGDNNTRRAQIGESNGRALLTEEDVVYIRECYNAHINFKQVYDEYKDIISKRGLQKVWWFDTWKNILPQYHNEENKYWHSHNAKANTSEIAANNKKSFSTEEVLYMRKLYNEGIPIKKIWEQYAADKSYSTVYNMITKKTYKNI